MQTALIFRAIEQAEVCQRGHEQACFSMPVHRQLKILVTQAGKITVGAVVTGPKDQADESPGPCLLQTVQQFFHFGVSWQGNRDAGVVTHE